MADGSVVYCTDGLRTVPVAAGGTGCIAKHINGQWDGRAGANAAGVATITSGNTGVVVLHGVGYTPGANEIALTLTGPTTNDIGFWWVHSITATQFVVQVRADPGASGATFGWQINP